MWGVGHYRVRKREGIDLLARYRSSVQQQRSE